MSQFRNLVFEGGGVKGIAYAGALEVLEAENVIPDIKRVAGTSAGAISAALVALGASSKDVAEIVGGTDFRSFMDDSFGLIRDTKRLIEEYGWYKGDAFASWIKKQIYVLSGTTDLNFVQLAEKAQKEPKRYRELFVVGTGLSMQLPIVFSSEDTRQFPIWYAVRVSMSIPLFFAAVNDKAGYQVLVDGGVTWNYPIDLFDDKKYNPAPGAFEPAKYPTTYDEKHIYNRETLGLRVDTKDEIKAEKDSWKSPPQEIKDFFDYIKALVGYMNEMANKAHLHTNDWHRTIFIDAGGVKTTDFSLSDDKVKLLVDNGRAGACAYFTWFKDPNASPKPLNRV